MVCTFVLYYSIMKHDTFDLSGKTALVTGGGRGIGLGIAMGLARHGANIALIARTEEQLNLATEQIESETGRSAKSFCFDLANLDAIEALFERIVKETGGIDILVNCAGTTIRSPAEEIKLEDWHKVQDVNLTSAMLLSQAFFKHCRKEDKPGRIINVGSLTCHAARPTTAPYAASKAGLFALTQTLATEWAKYNITVNAIGPGYIATELTEPLQKDEQFNKWVLSKTPLGRWGKPEDMAGTAVLLASKAGEFITGQIIYVDGGWLALL
jgi:gluconate 5-dehydrogenase